MVIYNNTYSFAVAEHVRIYWFDLLMYFLAINHEKHAIGHYSCELYFEMLSQLSLPRNYLESFLFFKFILLLENLLKPELQPPSMGGTRHRWWIQ